MAACTKPPYPVSPCILLYQQPERNPSSVITDTLPPLEHHAWCCPSSTEPWHHAGKIQILLIALSGRQSRASSALRTPHQPGLPLALFPSNRAGRGKLLAAISGGAAPFSLLFLHSRWPCDALYLCDDQSQMQGYREENLRVDWETWILPVSGFLDILLSRKQRDGTGARKRSLGTERPP